MGKTADRFTLKHKEGGQLLEPGLMQVIVDRETGVNYLFVKSGTTGGLTVLVDAQGKPIVSAIEK